MYKHILLPTDGSELSRQAVTSGILFAKNTGATVVGVHVIPLLREDRLEAWTHHDPHYAERRQALFDKFWRLSPTARLPKRCRAAAARSMRTRPGRRS